MSYKKNSRSSNTSSPARKRMIRASMATPDFCHIGSVMGNARHFIEAERAIEILHCLRRRALEQIIERGDDDGTLASGRHGESADLGVMSMRNVADPWRIIDDAHQRLVRVELPVSRLDRIRAHHLRQPKVYRHRNAAEMLRHMRQELDRQAKLARDFALVHMAGQRVRHQIIA